MIIDGQLKPSKYANGRYQASYNNNTVEIAYENGNRAKEVEAHGDKQNVPFLNE